MLQTFQAEDHRPIAKVDVVIDRSLVEVVVCVMCRYEPVANIGNQLCTIWYLHRATRIA